LSATSPGGHLCEPHNVPRADRHPGQIADAFPDDSAPSYLLRDRDPVSGEQFRRCVKAMRIEEVLTTPHSPWQTPFAERLIGSTPRGCFEFFPFFLRRALAGHP